jgi:hypothetical protein
MAGSVFPFIRDCGISSGTHFSEPITTFICGFYPIISNLVAGNREDKFIPFIRRMELRCNGYVGRRQPLPTSSKNEEGKRSSSKRAPFHIRGWKDLYIRS